MLCELPAKPVMTDLVALKAQAINREIIARKKREQEARHAEEERRAAKLSEFQQCVVQIRRVSWNRLGKLEGSVKRGFVADFLGQYFRKEERADVFEGFLRLFVEFGQTTKNNEVYVTPLIFSAFHEHIVEMVKEPAERRFILTETHPHDSELFESALAIAVTLKVRFLEQIALIFSLKMRDKRGTIISHITQMIEAKEWAKAVTWMAYFDVREEFDFTEISSQLYTENAFGLLKVFVGADVKRQRRLISHLDRLIGVKMGREQMDDASTSLTASLSSSLIGELERKMIADGKKLEKNVVKFMREFGVMDEPQLTPNTMTSRCRDCLLYYHYQWAKNKIPDAHYVETALLAMRADTFVRNYYLNFMCNNYIWQRALYFAISLNLDPKEYPLKLLRFCVDKPGEEAKVRHEIAEETERQLRQQEAEDAMPCELLGRPIIFVDTWEGMLQLIVQLPGEPRIGIDAEWKPNFLSLSEQVALIQVALSNAIYLVDVVVLEGRLDQNQWFQFFDTLLCSSSNLKIGFDFGNDLRVLCSTFPFISDLVPRFSNVICLYKLLSKVIQYPQASAIVFGPDVVVTNLNLSEVSHMLLDLKLDKSEQVGNWLRRPLRLEQKRYAALDAYCLIGCFGVVASRLNNLNNESLLQSLQTAALVTEKKDDAGDNDGAFEVIDGALEENNA